MSSQESQARGDRLTRAASVITDTLGLGPCPTGCGRLTSLTSTGGSALCLACTEQEIGMSALENGARISAGMSVRQFLARPPDAPLPLARQPAVRRRMQAR